MRLVRTAIAIAAAVTVVASTSALRADSAVSATEAEKIKAALGVWGCTGGKMEKETEGSGSFEVDDAKCNTEVPRRTNSVRYFPRLFCARREAVRGGGFEVLRACS